MLCNHQARQAKSAYFDDSKNNQNMCVKEGYIALTCYINLIDVCSVYV